MNPIKKYENYLDPVQPLFARYGLCTDMNREWPELVEKVLQDTTSSNEEKADAIGKISNGLQVVVGLVVKLLL